MVVAAIAALEPHAGGMTAAPSVGAGRGVVGVLYHPRIDASRDLAAELVALVRERGADARLLNAWEERGQLAGRLVGLDWAVALGGDGTVLRLAGLLASLGVPVIGVNFGRLGFLAQIDAADARSVIPRLLAGEGEVEERLMLRAACNRDVLVGGDSGPDHTAPYDAVNDVFVGRGKVAHAVRMDLAVDGRPLIRFAADGVIVATPTGSTAYSLSAGGPVVAPRMQALIITPVVPHPVPVRTIVLPATSVVDIRVQTEEEAICSIDGQRHYAVPDGTTVRVQAAPYPARFLRLGSSDQFYQTLVERLSRW